MSGDAAGAQADDTNISMIMEKAQDMDAIHAIILVVNGTHGRIDTTVRNTFARLKGMLPDRVLNNTLAVITNCTQLTV